MALKKYLVTKLFTGGLLEGLTHTEVTTVEWQVGQEVSQPIGGSPYRIVSVHSAEHVMPLIPRFTASSGRVISTTYDNFGSQMICADGEYTELTEAESIEFDQRLKAFRSLTRAQQEAKSDVATAQAQQLETMHTNAKIISASDKAESAFWEAVAAEFPEIKTGDIAPFASIKLVEQMRQAVAFWVMVNANN